MPDLAPTAILASSGFTSPDVGDVQDDPEAGDSEWLGATLPFSIRFGFDTPGALAGTQTVKVLVRAPADPAVTVSLYEAGALVRALETETIASTTGQVITATFDASEIADPADVEVVVSGQVSVVAPIAADGISDQTYTAGTAISSLNVAADFSGGGTVATYSVDVTSDPLPAGLSLNTGTGAITGTPTEAVSGTIVIRGTNAAGFDTTTFDIYVGLAVATWGNGASAAADTTSHALTMPSGLAASDFVGAIFSVDGNPNVIVNTGSSVGDWHKLGQASNSTVATQAIFWARYVPGLALTLTTSAAEQSTHLTFRVPYGQGLTGTHANGSSTNANPPSFTHPAGAANYLVVATCGIDAQVVPSGAPSGYSGLQTKPAAGANGASTGAAYDRIWTYDSATEDPAAFASTTEQWAAWTLFVHDTPPPLRFDTLTVTQSSLSLPAYLTPVIDPEFGVPLVRVSDNGNAITNGGGATWTADARNHYTSVSAWNCDETMLYLEYGSSTGRVFLDGDTYVPLFVRAAPSGFGDGLRWHPTQPNIAYYMTTSRQLRTWNVVANTTALVRDFSATYNSMSIGSGEAEFSDDGDYVAINATRIADSHDVGVIYRVSTDTVLGVISATARSKTFGSGRAQISPSGSHVHCYWNDETLSIYTNAAALVYDDSDTQQPSHGDVGRYSSADVIFGPYRGPGDIIRRLLTSNSFATLTTDSYGYFTSARNYLAGDWVASTYFSDSGDPYVGQVIANKKDGSRHYRICHQRSTGTPYPAEPHACLSPSGTRIIVGTDWGTGSGPVHAIVADFRGFSLP